MHGGRPGGADLIEKPLGLAQSTIRNHMFRNVVVQRIRARSSASGYDILPIVESGQPGLDLISARAARLAAGARCCNSVEQVDLRINRCDSFRPLALAELATARGMVVASIFAGVADPVAQYFFGKCSGSIAACQEATPL